MSKKKNFDSSYSQHYLYYVYMYDTKMNKETSKSDVKIYTLVTCTQTF